MWREAFKTRRAARPSVIPCQHFGADDPLRAKTVERGKRITRKFGLHLIAGAVGPPKPRIGRSGELAIPGTELHILQTVRVYFLILRLDLPSVSKRRRPHRDHSGARGKTLAVNDRVTGKVFQNESLLYPDVSLN